MRIYNGYIMAVATSLLLTTVVLVALGVNSLDAYYTSYVIEVLVVTEISRYFSPRARRTLDRIAIAAFGGFLLIIAIRIMKLI